MLKTLDRPTGFTRLDARPSRRAPPRLRLFGFPFAGGSARVFRDLAAHLGADVEVVGIDYPGRGQRFGEEPIAHLPDLVRDLAGRIGPLLDRPFAFYGHSNGALVAFELARYLARACYRWPEVLIVGAKRCPVLGPERMLHALPRDEFIDTLRGYGGTPAEVFASPDVLEVFLPILRADFALSETHSLGDTAPLDTPIHAIAGTADPLAAVHEVQAWRALTRRDFRFHRLDGGHFFLQSEAPALAALLRSCLAEVHLSPV